MDTYTPIDTLTAHTPMHTYTFFMRLHGYIYILHTPNDARWRLRIRAAPFFFFSLRAGDYGYAQGAAHTPVYIHTYMPIYVLYTHRQTDRQTDTHTHTHDTPMNTRTTVCKNLRGKGLEFRVEGLGFRV